MADAEYDPRDACQGHHFFKKSVQRSGLQIRSLQRPSSEPPRICLEGASINSVKPFGSGQHDVKHYIDPNLMMRPRLKNWPHLFVISLLCLSVARCESASNSAAPAEYNVPTNLSITTTYRQLANALYRETMAPSIDATSSFPTAPHQSLLQEPTDANTRLNAIRDRRVDELSAEIKSLRTTKWSDLSSLAQVVVLTTGLFYFLYRVFAGWYNTAMAIELCTVRVPHVDKHNDILITKLAMEHGEQGALYILAAEAKVVSLDPFSSKELRSEIIPLVAVRRIGVSVNRKHRFDYPLKCSIDWRGENPRPFRLSPKERTQFECFARVPKRAICQVELTLLGRKPLSTAIGHWRASAISVPNALAYSPEK